MDYVFNSAVNRNSETKILKNEEKVLLTNLEMHIKFVIFISVKYDMIKHRDEK